MRTVVRLLVTLSLVAAMVALAGVAHAACHAFTVEVDPSTGAEGQTVTVTIRRDRDVRPSSVRVRTVEVTATGGADYTELDERVQFTEGTEQTRQVDILDDEAPEDDETFEIELSEGQGCEINQNFTYDSATVTIDDDDAPAAESPAPEQTPTEAAATSDETAEDDLPDTGAGGPLAIVGLLVLLAAGGFLGRGRSAR